MWSTPLGSGLTFGAGFGTHPFLAAHLLATGAAALAGHEENFPLHGKGGVGGHEEYFAEAPVGIDRGDRGRAAYNALATREEG
jgi:hypothetical protein